MKLRSTMQESICHSILCEINFGKIWISKIAIFTISQTLDFAFWHIWDLKNGSNSPKSKFRTSKSAKIDICCLFELTKIWFHVKSKWQANCKISTLGYLNFTFWKFLEHSAREPRFETRLRQINPFFFSPFFCKIPSFFLI